MNGTDLFVIPIGDTQFLHTISGVIEFTTTLKADNIYSYIGSGAFVFNNSMDYQIAITQELVNTTERQAYNMGFRYGKEEGLAEGIFEGDVLGYARGLITGESIGYDKGYDPGST